jgi:hypothetical protein
MSAVGCEATLVYVNEKGERIGRWTCDYACDGVTCRGPHLSLDGMSWTGFHPPTHERPTE